MTRCRQASIVMFQDNEIEELIQCFFVIAHAYLTLILSPILNSSLSLTMFVTLCTFSLPPYMGASGYFCAYRSPFRVRSFWVHKADE
jgi:hypothetical protein